MNRKRTVSGPSSVIQYRQQQPLHPQYRTPGGRGATPTPNNAGRVISGQNRPFHQGQPSFRGRGTSGAVRGRGSSGYPSNAVHAASFDQSQGAWVHIQVWMPHAMSNVARYDPDDQYQQPEGQSWMDGRDEDGEM